MACINKPYLDTITQINLLTIWTSHKLVHNIDCVFHGVNRNEFLQFLIGTLCFPVTPFRLEHLDMRTIL